MKHKKLFRSVTALLAALVLMGGFSVTAFAGGGDVSDEPPTPVTETEPEETTGGYEPQPLTPEGNMSLVDDITGEASGDKQFITVVTKNGNYFYIIIDRAEDGENTVHFLNQVDEKDLLQLMEDEQTEAPACSCTEKCVAGSVNTDCPVCSVNMSECAGKEAEPELEETEQPEPEEEKEAEEQAVEDTAYFQMRQRIMELMSVLDETDAKLISLRFGLEGGMPLSPEETGKRLNLTPDEVVAREANALSKLRSER